MNTQNQNNIKIAAFVCNWCSYAGADSAGTSRLQYDDSIRIIRFPCTGRIDPIFIIKAFETEVDGVLVSGCHPGDCHYSTGNFYARRRFNVFRSLMEFIGLDLRRLHFSWVSAAEGAKWANVVNKVSSEVKSIPNGKFKWALTYHKKNNGQNTEHKNKKTELSKKIKNLYESFIKEYNKPFPYEKENTLTEQLRTLAKNLLVNNKVNAIIGYKSSNFEKLTTPVVITNPESVNQLVWNRYCVNNLTSYLTRPKIKKLGKIGIVVKACDSKSIIGLIQENQINRDDIFIIGIQCDGVLENEKILEKCLSCSNRIPVIKNEYIYDKEIEIKLNVNVIDEAIKLIENSSIEERWNFWQEEFSRCIRCYACRTVCPFCYCETCITDKHRPQWISPSASPKGNFSWNLIRAFHLSGRCIGCNECSRVCPVNIHLDILNRKIALEIKKEFEYEAGVSIDVSPPLTTYRPDDSQEFIL